MSITARHLAKMFEEMCGESSEQATSEQKLRESLREIALLATRSDLDPKDLLADILEIAESLLTGPTEEPANEKYRSGGPVEEPAKSEFPVSKEVIKTVVDKSIVESNLDLEFMDDKQLRELVKGMRAAAMSEQKLRELDWREVGKIMDEEKPNVAFGMAELTRITSKLNALLAGPAEEQK